MSDSRSTVSPPESRGDDARRQGGRLGAARLTSVLGVAFAVFFTAGLLLLAATPGPRATDDQVRAYYAAGDAQYLLLSGLYLVPLSAVAFLWFLSALRQWAAQSQRPIDPLQSTVQLLSGGAFITLTLAEAAASTVVAAGSRSSSCRSTRWPPVSSPCSVVPCS